MSKGCSHEPALYQSQRRISIGDFVSTRMNTYSQIPKEEPMPNLGSHNMAEMKPDQTSTAADGRSTNVDSQTTPEKNDKKVMCSQYDYHRSLEFKSIYEKSCNLAKIYNGSCISLNSYSNCKGRNSIRFNC